MTSVFLKVAASQQAFVLNQAPTLCRSLPLIRHPVWASVSERQYKSMPTHRIGRWKYLLLKQPSRKKKEFKMQMKPMVEATDTAYGSLNVRVLGYDMTLVEHYTQYIHNLCNRLGVEVVENYALQTKSMEVMLMAEEGTKMFVDATLKTHERVIQLGGLDTALCPVFLDVLLKNQPEGVELSVKEHTEADFQARFKKRPGMEGILAQLHQ